MNENEDEIARRSTALLRRLPSVTIRRDGKEVQVKYDPGLLTPHRACCIFVAGMATSVAPLGIAYGHFLLAIGILLLGAFCLFDGLSRPEEQKPSKWDALTDESTHGQQQITDYSTEASPELHEIQTQQREQNLQAALPSCWLSRESIKRYLQERETGSVCTQGRSARQDSLTPSAKYSSEVGQEEALRRREEEEHRRRREEDDRRLRDEEERRRTEYTASSYSYDHYYFRYR